MSKHEEIIKYIMTLKAGTKISVRSIANKLEVSEGTAYRAIKECDTLGFVTTIPRVGTIKIDKVQKKNIEVLTYGEIVSIIHGNILGGKAGINKTLNKFVIGAMTAEAMVKYISPGSLIIVGNREDSQKLSLLNNSAVLITGGFGCSDEIKKLADEKELPVISSNYDTFTIASIINKAISENLIKKDIILVEDIMNDDPQYLKYEDSAKKLKKYINMKDVHKLPVVNKNKKVVGIINFKHLDEDIKDEDIIGKLINEEPLIVDCKTTVAYAAHIMGWENIGLCLVVDNNKKLVGTIGRKEVVEAIQYALSQPQAGETIEDMILKNFEYSYTEDGMHFHGKIVSDMLEPLGSASWNSLGMLLSTAAVMTLKNRSNINVSIDSISSYFIKPVQMDTQIDIHTKIIDFGRFFAKVETCMTNESNEDIAKSMLSAKILKIQ